MSHQPRSPGPGLDSRQFGLVLVVSLHSPCAIHVTHLIRCLTYWCSCAIASGLRQFRTHPDSLESFATFSHYRRIRTRSLRPTSIPDTVHPHAFVTSFAKSGSISDISVRYLTIEPGESTVRLPAAFCHCGLPDQSQALGSRQDHSRRRDKIRLWSKSLPICDHSGDAPTTDKIPCSRHVEIISYVLQFSARSPRTPAHVRLADAG